MSCSIRQRLGMAVILVWALAGSGCIAAALVVGAGAGVGTYAYVDGQLKQDLPASPPQVVAATNAAFNDLQMTVISSKSTAVDGRVIARTAGDKRIKVRISSEAAAVSRVSIRVGFWGDEALSVRVLEAIRAHLGTHAPQDVPAPG